MAKKQKLFNVSREMPSANEYEQAWKETVGESDRSCAITCGAMLDQVLYACLREKLVGLNEDDLERVFYSANAVLGSLSARIEMAYALGIITQDVREKLDIIRKVRNYYAHGL